MPDATTVMPDGTAVRIQPGRALVLVGPQGCGKTTLAYALARRVSDHSGSIDAFYLHSVEDLERQAARSDVLIVDGWPRFLRTSTQQLLALCKLIVAGRGPDPRAEWLRPQYQLVFCLLPDQLRPEITTFPQFRIVHMPRKGQGVIA